jgi:hypothetical protein
MKIRKNLAISDTGFIFDPATGNSFSTNPIGLGILKLLKEEKKQEDIISKMCEEYETDAVTIERDVQEFITLLEKFRLSDHDET